ncbi:MAG: indole-3-glycerol phosphate synthase TrpC [Clostridiales bacterium]|nr:indole-3-glycerol phosphate synthase TrpC [Clostridiales bacterium]
MNINTFVQAAKRRLKGKMDQVPLSIVKELACEMDKLSSFPFEEALKKEGMSFICEIKRASPSAGIISMTFPYLETARQYQDAGADAVSVLTEPDYFKGREEHLFEISRTISLPTLRKDFVVHQYQLYEAKLLGASAVLLICAILDTRKLKEFIKVCDRLNLSALVEAHTREEIGSALEAGARVIGVNNRNLDDFTVDLQNSINLRPFVPEDILFVAESGIKTRDDIKRLEKARVNGVLIGETMMRSRDKAKILSELRGG